MDSIQLVGRCHTRRLWLGSLGIEELKDRSQSAGPGFRHVPVSGCSPPPPFSRTSIMRWLGSAERTHL